MLRCMALFLAVAGAMFGQHTFMFLRLDNINGDATMQGYEKQIEISGFSYDAEAGTMNRITLTKRFDISSPLLLQAAVTSMELHEATLSMLVNSGDSLQPFAVVTLGGTVLITAVHIQDQGATPPTESITLTFTKAEWCYGPGRRNCESFPTRSLPSR